MVIKSSPRKRKEKSNLKVDLKIQDLLPPNKLFAYLILDAIDDPKKYDRFKISNVKHYP